MVYVAVAVHDTDVFDYLSSMRPRLLQEEGWSL